MPAVDAFDADDDQLLDRAVEGGDLRQAGDVVEILRLAAVEQHQHGEAARRVAVMRRHGDALDAWSERGSSRVSTEKRWPSAFAN